MSKTKKIISLLLTVVLVMTMATVAIVSTSAAAKVYFEDSLNWGNITAYCYGGDGEILGSWPGTPCTDEGNGIWSIELDGTPEAIIFHANDDANQTSNIPFAGDSMIAKLTGEWIQGDYKMVAVAEFSAYGDAPADDPTDAPTDAPVVDDPTDAPVVDGDTITVYFTNNWMFLTQNVYYWGSDADPEWPGVAMTKVDTNEGGEDIYAAEIPANVAGIIFNGEHDQQPGVIRQTVDITDFADNTGYYCESEDAEGKIVVGSYEYIVPGEDDPTDAPVVDDPTTPDEDPTDAPVVDDPTDAPVVDEKGVSVNGTVYPVAVDSTITYTATITAAELFEDIQAMITYDADKLELVETKSTEACPNIVSGLVFNAKNAGVVKFNASYLDGYDFTTEKVLVTLTFNVKDDALSEIDLTIEEMTIITGESYFTNGEASKTEGITVTETLDAPEEPTTAPVEPGTTAPVEPGTTAPVEPGTTAPVEPTEPPVVDEKGVKVNDDVYAVTVGDEITYVVYLTADQLFEDVQAIITYDADKLELLETKSTEACPGLASGLVFNAKNPGEIKFNASFIDGYDFTEEGVFVTLKFNVKDNALSEIDLVIEEMTIVTGESYFTDSQPSVTEGITIVEVLEVPEQPTTAPVEPGTTAPVEPGTTAPVEPGTTAPVEPGTTAPVEPGTTAPVEPGTTTPDATSATGTDATDAPGTPDTGATAYIYVALAIVAMAAAAVVVLRKKANG